MRALLFDIDGVLFQQGRAIAGAADTIRWARQQQIPFRLLTNTTSKSRARICADLGASGIPVTEEQILSPPVAAREWLQEQHIRRAELLVPEGIRAEFAGFCDAGEPQAVVLGDMGYEFRFERLNQAFRLLMHNPQLPLVALGMTRYFAAADGLQLDVGPFVKALEYATGRTAVVMGKPAAAFFQQALHDMGVDAAQALMIGDDRIGDVLGAQACGIAGALVRTGKYRPGDEDADAEGLKPDYVLTSVAGLPALWEQLNAG